MKLLSYRGRLPKTAMLIAGFLVLGVVFVKVPHAAAACSTTAPATTYGQVTQTVNVTTAGTYRVWSRIKAPDTTNNSFFLQVDSGCVYVVGDATSGIPANAWTWVNYQNGTTSSPIDLVNLAAGSHTLKYTGREPNVQLDRVLLLSDLSCTPDNATKGDNCANPDQVSPTVSVSAPANNSNYQKGNPVTINATASDNVGVNRVEFLVDGAVVGSVPGTASSSYSFSWSTTAATVAAHSITVRATDAAGNATTSSPAVIVNVTAPPNPTDQEPPTITSFTLDNSSVQSGSSVTATVNATDNVGVTRVDFSVDGTVVGSATRAPYTLTWTPTGVGLHSVVATAYDAATNSTPSNALSLTVNPVGTLQGDANGDNHVNGSDYSIYVEHLNTNYPPADFNHDGTVSTPDLSVILAHWTW